MKAVGHVLYLLLLFVCFLGICSTIALGQKEAILYSFTGQEGVNPSSGLIFDKSGNLFGTVYPGPGMGAVFELTLNNGTWTENDIYTFCPQFLNCTDGSLPSSGLVLDSTGNLYGTALGGNNGCGNYGCGVVFELSPSNGSWDETVLYTFAGGRDGAWPAYGLVLDGAGNLYGTTISGGSGHCTFSIAPGCGTVFELSPLVGGGWKQTVLHSFRGGKDGENPIAGVIVDKHGHLYGTTAGSKPTQPGTVYRLVHGTKGWRKATLYRFRGKEDGNSPEAPVILDKAGNLYGTTRYGGTGQCSNDGYDGCGVVFKLSQANGIFKERVIHDFQGGTVGDGAYPSASLSFNQLKGVDGTASGGGVGSFCCGIVFRLTPGQVAHWDETILHSFGEDNGDGEYPLGSLISDKAGNLYSTTQYGGAGYAGTVFEISF